MLVIPVYGLRTGSPRPFQHLAYTDGARRLKPAQITFYELRLTVRAFW